MPQDSGRPARLIVNPASQGGHAGKLVPAVVRQLQDLGYDPAVKISLSMEEAAALASQADANELVVSYGGDGLHAHVAAGVAASGALMFPLPGGRGNDFVASLGGSRQVEKQIALINRCVEKRIDLGQVESLQPAGFSAAEHSGKPAAESSGPGTGDSESPVWGGFRGPRGFLGVVSVGFDTIANTYANQELLPPLRNSQSAYALGALHAALTSHAQEYTLGIDGETHTVLAQSVAVGQSGRYGGGMRICPQADPSDGFLDVVVIGDVNMAMFPALLLDVYAGNHLDRRHVRTFRAKEVTISTEGPVKLAFADGDEVGDLPVRISTKPGALRVLAPPDELSTLWPGFAWPGFMRDGFVRDGLVRDGMARDGFARDGFARGSHVGAGLVWDGFARGVNKLAGQKVVSRLTRKKTGV